MMKKFNMNGTVVEKGANFVEFLYKIDAVDAIQRKIEYREKHGLPQVYDVYTREPDGSFTHTKEVINKENI